MAVQRIGYILPQGNISTRESYNPSGFLLIGMSDSLGKTFTDREAAAKYAAKAGITVRPHPRKS